MNKKLWFLTKMSLNKKIKSKWFIVANVLFLILIVGLVNIDSIIKFFGGDFDKPTEIIVIDNASVFERFKANYENNSKYLSDYDNVNITLYDKDYDSGIEEVKEDEKVLIVINKDDDNYLGAKIVSNEEVSTITNSLISASLNNVRSEIVLEEYEITHKAHPIYAKYADNDGLGNNISETYVNANETLYPF